MPSINRTADFPLASGSVLFNGTFQTSRRTPLAVATKREPSAERLGLRKLSVIVVVNREIDPLSAFKIARSFTSGMRDGSGA